MNASTNDRSFEAILRPRRILRLAWLAVLVVGLVAPAFAGGESRARLRTGAIEPARLDADRDGFGIVNERDVSVRIVFDRKSARELDCAVVAAEKVRTAVYVVQPQGALECQSPASRLKYAVYGPDGSGAIEEVKGEVNLGR